MNGPGPRAEGRLIITEEITGRDRYQLLTSLVAPRPIAWVSTRAADGVRNLAPFSYFAALSATPFLVGISIGSRRGSPKDSLANIRESGVFCINIVTERHLGVMNESAGEHPPDVDEFALAGVRAAEGGLVAAPYVADCPAVFECRLHREVELGGAGNVLVIGEVVGVRLHASLQPPIDSYLVDPDRLRPVARLGGDLYGFLGETPSLPRPLID